MPEGTTIHLQQCLNRLHAGDPTARDELIACAANRLTTLTRKMFRGEVRLARWESPDDVAQSALLRLWGALRETKPQTLREFYSLAATQIRREMIDLARHHFGPEGAAWRHTSLPVGSDKAPIADPSDLSHEPVRLSVWAEFHEHVSRLPDDEREVFDLVFYQGLSHAESATVLGISKKTVQRRWHQGCATLHAALGGNLPGL